MPRIRTIKPEYWSDEKLSPLDDTTRLVFLGMISMADDAGRLLDNVKQIDAFIYPRTQRMAATAKAVQTLHRIGRIQRGVAANGQEVIQITNWIRHQKVDHPNNKAILPEIVAAYEVTDVREAFANGSRRTPVGLALLPVPVPVPPTTDQNQDATLRAHFETAWAAYPKRPANPKGRAWKAYQARVAAGEDPVAILAGVKAYAAYVEREAIPVKYIKHTATFFGDTKPYLDDYGEVTSPPIQLYDPVSGDMTEAAARILGRIA